MQKLIEGIHHFKANIFRPQREFFKDLARKQSPQVLFITCSDSRINPNLITQTDPGDLFILRNAGNIVPTYSVHGGGEAATIEFAVTGLGVRDVVVCGHTGCGAMEGLLYPDKVKSVPIMRSWLSHAEATRRIMVENYGHLKEKEARLTATVEENVLVQLENLRTHPCVAAALGRNEVNLHGWVYKLQTGDVFAFNPEEGQFQPITHTAPAVTNGHNKRTRSAI